MQIQILSRNILLGLAIMATLLACETTGGDVQEPILTEDLRQELEAIQSNYNPPACYFARFDIKATNASGQSEQAVGTIRADNQRQRMVMEFMVPYIRIPLSKIVIRDERVFINDKYNRKKFEVPLDQFAVGGMARNSIKLPFTRFQDVLYARLPEQVFKGRAVERSLQGRVVQIGWKTSYETYRYTFEARRLRQILYDLDYESNQQNVELKLSGAYGQTVFPRRMQIKAARPGGRPELMDLTFTYINAKVECLDSHFADP